MENKSKQSRPGGPRGREDTVELTGLTAVELGRRIKSGEIGVREATEAQLDMIGALEDKYHCYITVLRKLWSSYRPMQIFLVFR